MSRWLAYDETAERALAERFGRENVQPQSGDAEAILSAVVAAHGAAVALLPAAHGRTMLLTRRPLRTACADTAAPRAYAATGFLGLSDEPVYDDQPATPKSWWEKFWD